MEHGWQMLPLSVAFLSVCHHPPCCEPPLLPFLSLFPPYTFLPLPNPSITPLPSASSMFRLQN